VAKAKKPDDDALGVRLHWPETEPTSPIDTPRLRHPGADDAGARPRRRRARPKALPPAGTTSKPIEATSGPAGDGMAETLDRFTERVAVLTKAVDGLRSQLEERSRQVESLSTDLSVGLNSLQEAAEEVGRVRAVLAAQPTDELERQMSELIGEVKATRRSVAMSSTKKKTLDNDAVERIVRSVVERLTETRPAPKTNRSRRSSVAG
jgi:uncharacterized protein YoxC